MNIRRWAGNLSITSKAFGRYQWTANALKLLNGYSPFPFNVGVMLTLRCNLACTMCVERKAENLGFLAPYREPELPLEKWQDIIADIDKSFFFKPNLHIQGGEIGLYKSYLDLTAYAKQLGFRCTYVTNGTSLARDAADIVAIGVDVILVSIDGPRQVHDSIRGPGVFDNVAQGIQAIHAQKKAQGKKAPQIFINYAICSESYRHLSRFVDTAQELGVNYVTFLHYLFPDSEIETHNIDVDYLIQEIGRAEVQAAQKGIKLNYNPRLKMNQLATYYLQPANQLGRNCISPWLRMIIVPNGKIVPCTYHVMGDLSDGTTIKDVWNGEKFRSFRKRLSKNTLLSDCERCCRKQY